MHTLAVDVVQDPLEDGGHAQQSTLRPANLLSHAMQLAIKGRVLDDLRYHGAAALDP